MAESISLRNERLDNITHERFTYFKKEEFEVDWEKVSEGKFGCVKKVKLKLWREKCAIKAFITSTDYRYGCTVTEVRLNDFHSISFNSDLPV